MGIQKVSIHVGVTPTHDWHCGFHPPSRFESVDSRFHTLPVTDVVVLCLTSVNLLRSRFVFSQVSSGPLTPVTLGFGPVSLPLRPFDSFTRVHSVRCGFSLKRVYVSTRGWIVPDWTLKSWNTTQIVPYWGNIWLLGDLNWYQTECYKTEILSKKSHKLRKNWLL